MFTRLQAIADAVFSLHPSKKGLGIAAPQIGIGRRTAILRPYREEDICLLNATITNISTETDVRFEGCLSMFDVRGQVQRPLEVTVQAQDLQEGVDPFSGDQMKNATS